MDPNAALSLVFDADIFFARGTIRYAAIGAVAFKDDAILPHSVITVIAAQPGVPISRGWLEERLADMNDGCDVYKKHHFLDALVITGVKEGQHIPTRIVHSCGIGSGRLKRPG